ncbi:MAG: hypothetical protein EA001_08785 [Oscillatoriales cyanobacterium]|nr:MAG: hypothetical protein EA001_08785 [Oscillatoriales cyanobacterium]
MTFVCKLTAAFKLLQLLRQDIHLCTAFSILEQECTSTLQTLGKQIKFYFHCPVSDTKELVIMRYQTSSVS